MLWVLKIINHLNECFGSLKTLFQTADMTNSLEFKKLYIPILFNMNFIEFLCDLFEATTHYILEINS